MVSNPMSSIPMYSSLLKLANHLADWKWKWMEQVFFSPVLLNVSQQQLGLHIWYHRCCSMLDLLVWRIWFVLFSSSHSSTWKRERYVVNMGTGSFSSRINLYSSYRHSTSGYTPASVHSKLFGTLELITVRMAATSSPETCRFWLIRRGLAIKF